MSGRMQNILCSCLYTLQGIINNFTRKNNDVIMTKWNRFKSDVNKIHNLVNGNLGVMCSRM